MDSRLQCSASVLLLTFTIVSFFIGSSCSRQYRIDRASNAEYSTADAININTADKSELETLPHIGETLARRIVEFREQNGPFRRPENLLLVDGISEKRFKEIRPLIKTE